MGCSLSERALGGKASCQHSQILQRVVPTQSWWLRVSSYCLLNWWVCVLVIINCGNLNLKEFANHGKRSSCYFSPASHAQLHMSCDLSRAHCLPFLFQTLSFLLVKVKQNLRKFTVPQDFQRSFSVQELITDRLSLVGHLFGCLL